MEAHKICQNKKKKQKKNVLQFMNFSLSDHNRKFDKAQSLKIHIYM